MALPSGTVTLLFTDIEGSTALWESHRAEMERALSRHDELLRSAIEEASGYVFKTVGDAFCAAFSDAGLAIGAALRAQRALADEDWPESIHIRVRMGLHTGVCDERDRDYFGPAVNRAARLEAIAHGGQVLLSEVTAGLVREALPQGCALFDLGEHRLKDLGRPEHVFQANWPGLEETFPPLRSLDNPELEHNLPIQLTSFIGREKELSAIRRLVDDSRLVTLAGPAGSGKSRLALQIAADLLDGSGDGVWLVDLAPLSAEEQVAREIASVLGVREEASRPLPETLVESLQYRNVLLVLDNCEHVIDTAAKLAETILRQCPKVWLLATSREALGVEGERVYRVPPLELPAYEGLDPEAVASAEAVRLFVERAKERRPDFSLDGENVSAVVSLCRHLDGIPLALELAAAQLGSLSVAEVERRLSQRFRLLSARSRTRSARQQTLEGAIAWSYELLHEAEKLVFAHLSVFPGSFDLAAAESVCSAAAQIDEFEVVNLVQALVEKSLLQIEEGPSDLRYRMLETIGQYSADRLSDLGVEANDRARDAHALYYLALVEDAVPHLIGFEQLVWMKKIEADYDNIRTALAFLAIGPGHGLEALRMVGCLRPFWDAGLGGTFGEAHDLVVAALAHPEARPASTERSRALLTLGAVEVNLGEVAAARDSHTLGIEIARAMSDTTLLAQHLCSLAFVFYRQGEYRLAKETAQEALEMADAVGDPNIQAWAHDRLAIAETVNNNPSAARLHFASALRLYERVGNRSKMSASYNNLGNLEMITGDVDAARSGLEAALEHAETSDNRVVALANLGFVSQLEGNIEAAQSNYRDALRLSVRLGFFAQAPYSLLGRAVCWGASGDLERSAALHGAADAMIEAQGQPWEPAEADVRAKNMSTLRQRMGELAFKAAYSRGHEMNGPDAITLGLGDEEKQTVA